MPRKPQRSARKKRTHKRGKLKSLPEEEGSRLQRYIVQLKEDLDIVMKMKSVTKAGDENLMPSVQFYRRFTQNAVVAIRKVPVDVDLTLEDVLREALTAGKGAPRKVCDHCTYIGRCTAAMCAKEPDRIVRICAPDAATACRATLCFDAVELQEYLETQRSSDMDPIPNPAIALGVSSGALLNVDDLETHLDKQAEQVLRWQVDMWKEVGQLQGDTQLDPVEYGFLRAIVLPSIHKRITNFTETSFVGRWWRMTPELIKKALRIPANALLYLMDHPWVTWLALWVAKILRFVWCLSVFGVDAAQMKAIKARIRDVLSLSYQFPFIGTIVDTIGTLLDCFMNGNLMTCTFMPLMIGERIMKGMRTQFFGMVTDSISAMGKTFGVGKGFSKIVDLQFMLLQDDNFSLSFIDIMKYAWDRTGVNEMITSNLYVQPLHREIRNLYNFTAYHLALGTGLWVMRHLPLGHLFKVFDMVAMFVPPLAASRAGLEMAIGSLLKKRQQLDENSTIHAVVVAMVNDVSFVQQVTVFLDLISVFGNLLGCGVIALLRRFPGPWSFMAESPAACCTDSILSDLKFAKKHTPAQK